MDDNPLKGPLYGKLPPEAGTFEGAVFHPNNSWLANASEGEQDAAVRQWFLTRFEDPANHMPFDSREGGYFWVYGGPYDPDDEIQERFSGIVPDKVLAQVIRDLVEHTGSEWAPIPTERDYEMGVSLLFNRQAFQSSYTRLDQLAVLVDITVPDGSKQVQLQMIHGAVIATLEATLGDAVASIVLDSDTALRTFVANNKDMQQEQMPLSEIFDRHEKIKDSVRKYLSDLVWHRLDKIKAMVEACLGVAMPNIGKLMAEVQIRHDIVHRAGKTKDGEPITLSPDHLKGLIGEVRTFLDKFEEALAEKYGV